MTIYMPTKILSIYYTMSLQNLYCILNLVGYKPMDLSHPMNPDTSLQKPIYQGGTFMPTRPIVSMYVYKLT